MYNDQQVKIFLQFYQKYRRLQARRLKLQNGKPKLENVKKMQAMLAQIHGILTDMDTLADELDGQSKKAARVIVKADHDDLKDLVN